MGEAVDWPKPRLKSSRLGAIMLQRNKKAPLPHGAKLGGYADKTSNSNWLNKSVLAPFDPLRTKVVPFEFVGGPF